MPDAAPNGAVNLPRSVVLVEGTSDGVALHTLAERLGRDLEVEGVRVVAMGGALKKRIDTPTSRPTSATRTVKNAFSAARALA